MTASIRFFLLLSALLSGAPVVWAQSVGPLTDAEQAKLRKNVTDKNYLAVQSALADYCAKHFSEARSPNNTIYKRAESATAAVQCVGVGRAAIMAADGDADARLRARELSQPLADEAAQIKKQADAETEFMGLTWGLGFGFSFASGEGIDDAEIVNGIVRVKSQKKQQPRVVMEFHKYLWCNKGFTDGTRGCGPFVAVAASQENVLSGVAIGFMYGLKTRPTDSDGFSIGVGAILDGKVKDLADGFRKNETPPAGETTVRFEEKSRWSALLFVTRTF